MNVYLTSLGCRLNEAELQAWAQDFSQYGMRVVDQPTEAGLIVINTCAVTAEAARKSRQTIRRYHRNNPNAKLMVTGCYATLESYEAGALLGVDLVISNQQKHLLAEKAKELLEWQSMPYAATMPDAYALFTRNRERAFIKIQDGCRYRCTYCIVTVARGDEASRPIKDIVQQVEQLIASGIQEIVLTGVHVGGYGADLDTDLYQLVVALLQQTRIPRIRFASVEPWDIPDRFFELFKNNRLMPHMHLPVQSGSDRILKKMSRRCNVKTFLLMLERARKIVPEFNITSDIIVGFPGESEQDFERSLSIIKQAQFGHVHVFVYSKREGTKAAKLNNQIDEMKKKIRSKRAHQLAIRTKQIELKKMLGETVAVLWEGEGKRLANGKRQFFGYTPNYHKVCVEINGEISIANQIINCEIFAVDERNILCAKLIAPHEMNNEHLAVKQIS